MPSFQAPVDQEYNPPTVPYYHPGNKLFRHYHSRPAGRNVYIYSNGSVTETDPDGSSTLWSREQVTSDNPANVAFVYRVFWGGHAPEQITAAEALLLTNAGYEVIP